MSTKEMDMKAKAYFSIMSQIEALQTEAEAIRDSFKAAMTELEEEALEGIGWRATWHTTKTSRFDTKRFKADHGDIYDAYTVKSFGTRFTLNAVST